MGGSVSGMIRLETPALAQLRDWVESTFDTSEYPESYGWVAQEVAAKARELGLDVNVRWGVDWPVHPTTGIRGHAGTRPCLFIEA